MLTFFCSLIDTETDQTMTFQLFDDDTNVGSPVRRLGVAEFSLLNLQKDVTWSGTLPIKNEEGNSSASLVVTVLLGPAKQLSYELAIFIVGLSMSLMSLAFGVYSWKSKQSLPLSKL
jgi:hypothetical protein